MVGINKIPGKYPVNAIRYILGDIKVKVTPEMKKGYEYVLEQVKPRNRNVIEKYFKEHLTFREIAGILEISAERVKQLLVNTVVNIRGSYLINYIEQGINWEEDIQKLSHEEKVKLSLRCLKVPKSVLNKMHRAGWGTIEDALCAIDRSVKAQEKWYKWQIRSCDKVSANQILDALKKLDLVEGNIRKPKILVTVKEEPVKVKVVELDEMVKGTKIAKFIKEVLQDDSADVTNTRVSTVFSIIANLNILERRIIEEHFIYNKSYLGIAEEIEIPYHKILSIKDATINSIRESHYFRVLKFAI